MEKITITRYQLSICMGEIHYSLFLKNMLPFLNDKQINELINHAKNVKCDLTSIEEFLNNLNMGTFKLFLSESNGAVKDYWLIRAEL